MNAATQSVMASFHRSRGDGEMFATFYQLFLDKSPDIRAKFANTDFERQQLMLKESLLEMLALSQGIEGAEREVRRLGLRHGKHGVDVEPRLYAIWLDSLCETLARHDPQFDTDLERQWRAAMQPGIDLMIAQYDVDPGPSLEQHSD